MKFNVFIAVVIISLCQAAISQATPPREGAYVTGFIGGTMPQDSNASVVRTVPGGTSTDTIKFNPNLFVGASSGYDFGLMRVEGELSYKHGDISSITERSNNTRYANIDGSLGALALMINSFVQLHNSTPITPYFGGGAGIAVLLLGDTEGTDTGTGARTKLFRSDHDMVFAYQAGGGFELALTPRLSLDLSYRYFATSDGKFNSRSEAGTEAALKSHNAALGIRCNF